MKLLVSVQFVVIALLVGYCAYSEGKMHTMREEMAKKPYVTYFPASEQELQASPQTRAGMNIRVQGKFHYDWNGWGHFETKKDPMYQVRVQFASGTKIPSNQENLELSGVWTSCMVDTNGAHVGEYRLIVG